MTYKIDCEADLFLFERVPRLDTTGMIALLLKGTLYWYEEGDSYLYDAPEGGTSYSLGDIYHFGD